MPASSGFRSLTAEALGTFLLVLGGCGAIVVDQSTGVLGHVGVALSFGLVVFVAVAATGHVSGAHLNPAVTLAFAALGRTSGLRQVASYISAQLFGALAAATALRMSFPTSTDVGATTFAGDVGQALLVEVLLTASLMFVIVAVATDRRAPRALAAPAIGATVALGALWGGPITGASMNPARSLGPALASGTWTGHWLYWLGPILGALLGAWAYELLREPETPGT